MSGIWTHSWPKCCSSSPLFWSSAHSRSFPFAGDASSVRRISSSSLPPTRLSSLRRRIQLVLSGLWIKQPPLPLLLRIANAPSSGKRHRSIRRRPRSCVSGLEEEGHVEPAVLLVALLSTVGIVAFTVVQVARLFATRRESSSPDVTARLEERERSVQGLEQELAETQERLDFAERLLSKSREEPRIGG